MCASLSKFFLCPVRISPSFPSFLPPQETIHLLSVTIFYIFWNFIEIIPYSFHSFFLDLAVFIRGKKLFLDLSMLCYLSNSSLLFIVQSQSVENTHCIVCLNIHLLMDRWVFFGGGGGDIINKTTMRISVEVLYINALIWGGVNTQE